MTFRGGREELKFKVIVMIMMLIIVTMIFL